MNVTLPDGGPVESAQWRGESVVLRRRAIADPSLSVGEYAELSDRGKSTIAKYMEQYDLIYIDTPSPVLN